MESNKATIYVRQDQKPADQRLGLNLMITMLSQSLNQNGETYLADEVIQLAEFFTIMDIDKVPSRDMVRQILMQYSKDDIPKELLKKLINGLSNDIFDESPAKKKDSRAKTQNGDKSDDSGSESEEEPQLSRSRLSQQVQVTTPTDFTALCDAIMQKTKVQVDEERDEELLAKITERLHKVDKGCMVALFKYHAMSKQSTNDQGRAAASIMQSIDASMHKLITFPHADGSMSTSQIRSVKGSLTLACLFKNIYGRDHMAVEKQLRQIQQITSEYSKAKNLSEYKKILLTEVAIYVKIGRWFNRKQDTMQTDYDLCQMLLKEVYLLPEQKHLAVELRRDTDRRISPLSLEEVLTKLEENRRLQESLGEESRAQGKTGGAKSTDRDKKVSKQQPTANPAVQQQPKCPSCGNEHDISKCPKEQKKVS